MEILNGKFTDLVETNDDTIIVRYFSAEKLDYLINKEALCLPNSKKFLDKNERQLPKCLFTYKNDKAFQIHNKIEQGVNDIVKAYIMCWSKFDDENYALWKIYNPTNDGVCCFTTVGKLKKHIKNSKNDYIIIDVEYIKSCENRKKDAIPEFQFDSMSYGIMIKEKYKMYPYAYENESRIIVYSKSNLEYIDLDLDDIGNIFDRIIINPFMNEELRKNIGEKIEKIFNKKIVSSIINESKW